MLCSQFHLVRQEQIGRTVKLLPCRNWHCEHCQPNRLKQLRAMAASGEPNACLTLTVNTATGESPVERYRLLHNAWKILAKRILREFSKPASERWRLETEDGHYYHDIQSYNYTKGVAQKKITRLHYMAFPEETENGEPHLHILLRCKYIPQHWISQQMKALVNSPIVWIEKVKGARSAVAYVTKYVTTAPAQFGKSKRYWCSRFYQLTGKKPPADPLWDRLHSRLVNLPFSELIRELVVRGSIAVPQGPRLLHILTLRELTDSQNRHDEAVTDAKLLGAYLWLQRWKRECRI